MRGIFAMTAILSALLFGAGQAHAQASRCDGLSAEQKALAAEIMSTQHPYDCCDDTILNCLDRKPTCILAMRLAKSICRQVTTGQDKAKIIRGLSRRARSMLPAAEFARIDLTGVPKAGSADAPVILVEYGCPRCPFCSEITPMLREAVTDGALKGKTKLYFKIFPIRGHAFSKEAALAFMASAELGRFWEYALHAFSHFDSFSVEKQAEWAEAVGLDRKAFQQVVEDPATETRLVEIKKEGILNKVEITPTFFINGREYVGELGLEDLIDVVEEEFDRLKNANYTE